MEAVQYSDVQSLEDDAADQTMHTLLEENKESSSIENAEVIARMFEYRPGFVDGAETMFEYLPGFVDGARTMFPDNSGIDIFIYPRKNKSSHFLQAEVAAKHKQPEPSAKFDDLEISNDDCMLLEKNTEKMFSGIVFEAMPEHEICILETTSETSETILVPSKCENEHSTQKVDAWPAEAGISQYVNKQGALLQGTGQLTLSATVKISQPGADNTDDLESVNCDPYLQNSVCKAHLEREENKHLQGHHCVHLVRNDSASKENGEPHGIVERFLTLDAIDKPEAIIPSQNEENTNLYLEGEQIINMGKAVILLKQQAEACEHDEENHLLGAVRKTDLIVIQAERKEENEIGNKTLCDSIEGDVKTEHGESSEKQLEREEQWVSLQVNDKALMQHDNENISNGKLSIFKALNMPNCDIEEKNLRGGEKPCADTNQSLSIVSEGGAEILPKVYNNINEVNIGDLVWAKVRSHPWWPAQIFNPAHASETAKKLKQFGRVLIAFFGDCTFAWLQKSQLIAFQPNFEKMVKQTDNKVFCKGVAEALEVFCKLSELGLICKHYRGSLHSSSTYSNEQSDSSNIVSAKNCKLNFRNAERIEPAKTLEFIKSMACNPFGSCKPTLEAAELRGHAYGFRGCMIALSRTDLIQNVQPGEALSVHHRQQKRKSSSVDLCIEAGTEAKEMKKKVKTFNVAEMERQEDGEETLLALACYHPKLLKRLEKQRSRKDLQCHPARKMGCKQTFVQLHDIKPISGSKSSSMSNSKKTIKACCKRRKKSEAEDAFSFTTSESEEILSEAGIKVQKGQKKLSSAEVRKLTRSKEQFNLLSPNELHSLNSTEVEKPKETKMSNLENKSSRLSCVGHTISKVAIELAGRPPLCKSVGMHSKKTRKFDTKKRVIGSTAKTRSSSKHDKAVFQGSALDECHFSTVQLHHSLKLLARDPLNKADMIRSPCLSTILLRFRAEVAKTKDIASVLLDDVEKAAAGSLNDAQIEFQDALKDDQLSRALDISAFKTCNELPGERSTDSFQAAQKGKSKMTHRMVAKSSRKCATSVGRKRLYSPVPEVREPLEPRPVENNGEPFLGGTVPAASSTRSFSQRNYKKFCAPLQLGIFMQFSEDVTLPSEAQLKDLFVQFGPVQPSGVTVFKDLASAQVVFTHGEDAKAAYKHVKRTAMFGRSSVIYKLCHFSFPVSRKKNRAFLGGSSARAREEVPSHKDEHTAKCLNLATSFKERVNRHLKAESKSSRKRTKNGQEGSSASMQHSRNGKTPANHKSFNLHEDLLQERMMTLIRRVSVIVGTPNVTPNTKKDLVNKGVPLMPFM